MKKATIAALAALMLAGALSAVNGMTPISSTTTNVVAEGSAPIPLALPSLESNSAPSSLSNKF